MDFSLPGHLRHPGYLHVLVTGGRDYANEYEECEALDRLLEAAEGRHLRMVVIQGGASGADAIARQWAWNNNVRLVNERANWAIDGKGAGPRRNQRMIDRHTPDLCLALPGGTGTADMVERCVKARIPVLRPTSQLDSGR